MIEPYYQSELVTLYHGDCLDVMRDMPANSIDLIATDPPYFRVKDEPWDRQWDTAQGFIDWVGELCQEWQRILKPNGSLYVFASPQMSRRVENKIGETFNVLNNIRWIKEQGWHKKADEEILRSYLSPWEAVIFAEHFNSDNTAKGEAGYIAACDDLRGFVFEPIRAYLDGERRRASINFEQVRQMVGCAPGSGLPSHWFTQSQWGLPTAEQYRKLQTGFGGDYLRREYEDLRREYEDLRREYEDLRREYEDLRRPFALNGIREDLWRFDTVQPYPGKHPCEKPLALMQHIVRTSSRPGDVVLDCFAGSGVTLRAAQNVGRRAIGIEKARHYCHSSRQRLEPAFEAALVDTGASLDDLPLFAT